MSGKVIATNRKALRKKYGQQMSRIDQELALLIAADGKRGLATQLIDVSSAAEMKKVGGSAVKQASNPKQNKQAIDAIFRSLAPDYLLILGSIDVIPHQDLKNPVYDGTNDLDQHAWGDIPYACVAPYSTNPGRFLGPTRVIGRLPDLTNGRKADYLVKLLKNTRTWKRQPAAEAKSYFAVSAEVWKRSSKLSLKKLFGDSKSLKLSPSDGFKWKASELKPRMHFINCHGAPADMHFYGEGATAFPIAHQARHVATKIGRGTVAAAECCYGADLYDPGLTSPQHPSICNTYLERGAHGFFGSSTIAYGPANSNSAADLICQYFLAAVAAGASLGRAALEARQKFAQTENMTSGINLKTLAQFNLLGDPSVHPFEAAEVTAAPKTLSMAPHAVEPNAVTSDAEMVKRRRALVTRGHSLTARIPIALRKASTTEVRDRLRQVAHDHGLVQPKMMTFVSGRPAAGKPTLAAAGVGELQLDFVTGVAAKAGFGEAAVPAGTRKAPARVHVMMGSGSTQPAIEIKSKAEKAPRLSDFVAVVVEEFDGELTNIQTLHAK